MDWFCLTEEQILASPEIDIPNPEVFCNIKVDVVLNIRRSVNQNYDKDIKDEISKSCKDFKTKKMFEDYLTQISDEEDQNIENESKQEMAKKLENFDQLMDKKLAKVSSKQINRIGESQSFVNKRPQTRIVKIIQKF
jgi:hypothetical protein